MPRVVGIAAVARNGVIGADGDMPWRLPEDLKRFRRLTDGHVLVMGRRTYDSIGRPLPGRTTVVVTRNPSWQPPGVRVAASVEDALDMATAIDPDVVFVTGGGEIYRALWDRITHLEVTEVPAEPDGDVTFPAIDPAEWRETDRRAAADCTFVSYVRS